MNYSLTKDAATLLNQKQVATMLCMSEAWMEQCRFKNTGIPYVKIGKAVRYRLSDVNEFIENRIHGQRRGHYESN